MFASILRCIHCQHREYIQRQAGVKNWSDVLPVIQGALPKADVVVDSSTTEEGVETVAEVRDANGRAVCIVGCSDGLLPFRLSDGSYAGLHWSGGKTWNRRDTFVLTLVVASFLVSVVR